MNIIYMAKETLQTCCMGGYPMLFSGIIPIMWDLKEELFIENKEREVGENQDLKEISSTPQALNMKEWDNN